MNEILRRRRGMMGEQKTGPSYLTGYDEIGTPTITDGILTPSATSWITLPQILVPENKPWKIITKVYNMGNSGYQNIFGGGGIIVQKTPGTNNSYLYLRSTSSGTYNIINGGVYRDIGSSVWRYIKLEFTGTKYLFGYSDNGATYENTEVSSALSIYGNAKIAFGPKSSNTVAVNVKYDLNETEIWIDGEIWWKAIA